MRWLVKQSLAGLLSRIGVAIAAASLLFAPVVLAAEMKDLTQNIPRGYFGEFRWDGDKTLQNVVVTFDSVTALKGDKVEALGCGAYEIDRRVTKIKVRMLVRLSDLQVEIFEASPEGNSLFETGGSHRGTLSKDFQQIEAQWVTTAGGQKGRLHLHASSSLTCAPAAST
jgi:hypothetical protein